MEFFSIALPGITGHMRMVLITQSMTPGTVLWFCAFFAFRNLENGHIFLKKKDKV